MAEIHWFIALASYVILSTSKIYFLIALSSSKVGNFAKGGLPL
jgi:hypothetical protein